MNFVKKTVQKFLALSKKRKICVISLLLFAFIMSWAFIGAGIITANFNRSIVKGNANQQRINASGIIITDTKNSQKHFEIYGENGNYDNTEKLAILNNVIGNFYKDEEIVMSFQSTKGSYNEKTKQITLMDNIYIVMKDETSLEADKLVWTGSDQPTVAEGNVKIRRGNQMTAHAEKCIISAGNDKIKIVGKTKTLIYEK